MERNDLRDLRKFLYDEAHCSCWGSDGRIVRRAIYKGWLDAFDKATASQFKT